MAFLADQLHRDQRGIGNGLAELVGLAYVSANGVLDNASMAQSDVIHSNSTDLAPGTSYNVTDAWFDIGNSSTPTGNYTYSSRPMPIAGWTDGSNPIRERCRSR